MRIGLWLSVLMSALGITAASTPVHAVSLQPGANVTPSLSAANPLTAAGNSILAHTNATVTGSLNGAFLDVTYDAWVVRVGAGNLAPNQSVGNLDFVYQFHVNDDSSTVVESTSHFNFSGVTTDVSYFSVAAGQLPPNVATRSAQATNGQTLKFNFLGDGDVVPGQTSALEIIATNATHFTVGNYTFQDGVTINASAFQPGDPTPEPSSIVLAGSALAIGLLAAHVGRRALAA